MKPISTRRPNTDLFVVRPTPSKPTLVAKPAPKPVIPSRTFDSFETKTSAKGSTSVTPTSIGAEGSASASGSVQIDKDTKASGRVEVKGEVKGEKIVGDERTSWEVSATASVGIGGEVSGKVAGVGAKAGGSITVEVKGSLKISVPNDKMDEVKDLSSVNPWQPESMPVGTIITVDASLSGSINVEGSGSRKIGPVTAKLQADLGLSASTEVAVTIEKTGPNKVKVTAGPKSSIDASGHIGVSADIPVIGEIGAKVGGEYHETNEAMMTAEFDLATPEGKAAYDHFMATGELPKKDGPGVSGCSQTKVTKTSSEWEGSVTAAGEKLTLFGGDASSSTKETTHSDGSRDVEVRVRRDSDDLTVVIKRSYKPDGSEDLSKRETTYEVKVTPENKEQLERMLSEAYGRPMALREGDTVSVAMNEEQQGQMEQSLQGAQSEWYESQVWTAVSLSLRDDVDVPGVGEVPVLALDPDAAVVVARRNDAPLPGTVVVKDANGNVVEGRGLVREGDPENVRKINEQLEKMLDAVSGQ